MVDNTNLYKIHLNTFLMASYRTSMQIIGDLLTATEYSGQEGIKTTALITKANLPHSRLSKFLSNLTGSGLINKIEFDGKHTFVITPKGRQYLETYVKFANVAESFGLDL
jgi:predicted transcriptional regulator